MHIALSTAGDAIAATELDDDGAPLVAHVLPRAELSAWVSGREPERPRWVWDDTARWYPDLLRAGIRVDRCHDLRLCHVILRTSVHTTHSELARAIDDPWSRRRQAAGAPPDGALFALAPAAAEPDPVAEFRRQRATVGSSAEPGRLNLLLAAESVGALVAAELSFTGLPWDAARHDAILRDLLGPPAPSGRPARMEALAAQVRQLLDAPALNPDSQQDLLRALQNAGLRVDSTSKWELKRQEHPVVEPLLEYKKLARLLSANGWHWLEQWVHDGRFRPVYVVGGVVTGRWASDGGGALQLPKQVRAAVVPDPGWRLVVADAAQLEPRVLAAMSGDAAMARAGQALDLYTGIVESGAVETREEAKYGMLGAIYGGTTGQAAKVKPRLERSFPRAMGFVEAAARAGERGDVVTTWLGRSSPPGGHGGYDETVSDAEQRRRQLRAAAWGRFTRNFVVQGTAAEWALCWLGSLRRRLWRLGDGRLEQRPHLVFFLHDEVIVHTPTKLAGEVEAAVRESAAEAGRLLFGAAPVEFALSVATVNSYADAS